MINRISAVLLLIVGPFSIGYGIWELQILGEWPLGEGVVWGWLDSIMGAVLGVQGDLSNWFGAEVNVFGWETDRTALLGWPFLIINLVVVVGGLIARSKRRAEKAQDEAAADEVLAEAEAAAAEALNPT